MLCWTLSFLYLPETPIEPIDLIKTRKELFAEIFQDALEEVGLGNAIAEGRRNEFVPEENIFALLDGDVA